MQKIYLDNNSSTALDPRVLSAMMVELTGPAANPSSVHSFGMQAKKLLQEARRTVANYFHVLPEEIIFTSGGTESINLMLRSLPKGHIITSDIEHASVYKTIQSLESQGFPVTYISPKLHGAPSLSQVEEAIRPDTKAIVLFASNNETGVKLDIHSIATLCLARRIPFYLDAVSYIGKESFPVHPGITAIALSAHKFHGPKGIGALISRSSIKLTPELIGGNQESTRRAGTENLAGAIGLAEALKILTEHQSSITKSQETLKAYFETELFKALPNLSINGQGPRVSNTSNILFEGCDGESLLLQLDMEGIATSLGSACSSGALEPSRVLTNMGLDRKSARSSLRFSLSRQTSKDEIDKTLSILIPLVQKLRSFNQ